MEGPKKPGIRLRSPQTHTFHMQTKGVGYPRSQVSSRPNAQTERSPTPRRDSEFGRPGLSADMRHSPESRPGYFCQMPIAGWILKFATGPNVLPWISFTAMSDNDFRNPSIEGGPQRYRKRPYGKSCYVSAEFDDSHFAEQKLALPAAQDQVRRRESTTVQAVSGAQHPMRGCQRSEIRKESTRPIRTSSRDQPRSSRFRGT